MSLTADQTYALQLTSRIASSISLVGCALVCGTFLASEAFRKPINRLIFYATLGTIMTNISTLMSQAGPAAGSDSARCQFQAFLIQMFFPADVMWNLAMAINVYLTVFRKYNSAQLQSLEWIYLLVIHGTTFIVAITLRFVETQQRGKVYGSAILWCWIRAEWDFMRILTGYGPQWVFILITFAIYVQAARHILRKRRELRACNQWPEQAISSSKGFARFLASPIKAAVALNAPSEAPPLTLDATSKGYGRRSANAAMKGNTAAWAYTKCALLFFASLLITWLPSSINRFYELAHPHSANFGLNYTAGLVLPLRGFWNAAIYFTTSWAVVRAQWATFKDRRAALWHHGTPSALGGSRSRTTSGWDRVRHTKLDLDDSTSLTRVEGLKSEGGSLQSPV